jgi:hypothetical protein
MQDLIDMLEEIIADCEDVQNDPAVLVMVSRRFGNLASTAKDLRDALLPVGKSKSTPQNYGRIRQGKWFHNSSTGRCPTPNQRGNCPGHADIKEGGEHVLPRV